MRLFVAACLIAALASAPALAAAPDPKITIMQINGHSGHAFVYAQVTDSRSTTTAPMGNHATPYYTVWIAIDTHDPTCPLKWIIPIYERATGRQINPARPGQSGSYGVRNSMCAEPHETPVGTTRDDSARGLLALDLRASAEPPSAKAGKPVTIKGFLTSRIDRDLGMFLSMSIRSWEVASWRIAFGDGRTETYPGGTRSIEASHAYAQAGNFAALVTAQITGRADAAEYGADGTPYVFQTPFSVEVSNRTDGRVTRTPVIRHIPPVLAGGAAPAVPGQPAGGAAFPHIDAMRGLLTTVYPRVVVVQPGYITEDGIRTTDGVTSMVGWEYLGGVNEAPPGTATVTGARGGADEAIWIQWDRPGPVRQGRPEDYRIPVRLFARTAFADGLILEHDFTAGITVTVRYTAISH